MVSFMLCSCLALTRGYCFNRLQKLHWIHNKLWPFCLFNGCQLQLYEYMVVFLFTRYLEHQRKHVTSRLLFSWSPPLCPSTQVELTVFVLQVNKACRALIQPSLGKSPAAAGRLFHDEEGGGGSRSET